MGGGEWPASAALIIFVKPLAWVAARSEYFAALLNFTQHGKSGHLVLEAKDWQTYSSFLITWVVVNGRLVLHRVFSLSRSLGLLLAHEWPTSAALIIFVKPLAWVAAGS